MSCLSRAVCTTSGFSAATILTGKTRFGPSRIALSRLSKFKKVKPKLYNFRCPICGDSKKNKNKARGFLYQVKNDTNFKCHNCGVSMSFYNFLKNVDPTALKKYAFEKLKENRTARKFSKDLKEKATDSVKESKPVFKRKVNIDLPSAFDVKESELYLHRRAIFGGNFYYAQKFKQFVNTLVPNKFTDLDYDDSRIIIPLVKDSKLIGLQGRSLGPSNVKYITVMLSDDAPKIYGFDEINHEKPIYIVEGPFDSTFLENSIAMVGSDIDIRSYNWSNYIWVYDNEPRNREIINRIESTIDRGDKVVIWPSGIDDKDINDMFNSGIDPKSVIESNIYQGLQAKLQLNNWKKI